MSARAALGSVRLTCTLRAAVSARRASSDSTRASVCQLPLTSSSIANSEPSAAIRLSAILPPQSLMTRVSSWTMPVRSLPIAETARCCFIGSEVTVLGRQCTGSRGACERRLASCQPWPVTSPAPSLIEQDDMFAGSMVAIVTPMHVDGSIDWPAWERLLAMHLEAGTSGVVVGGTTGESATITDAEVLALVERARARLAGRAVLLAGAGSSSTAVTVERARRLSAAGVDGLLVVTPAYNKPTQEGLYRHFEAVAAAATVPVVLYNVPARTAVDLLPPTVARLSKLPRVVAVKEAVASLERVRALVELTGPHFTVLSGDDASAAQAMLNGARGVISVTANVSPKAMAELSVAALRGDRAAAEHLDAPLRGLHDALFLEPNPIPVKWVMSDQGWIDRGIRLPLTELSEPLRARVRAALDASRGQRPLARAKSA